MENCLFRPYNVPLLLFDGPQTNRNRIVVYSSYRIRRRALDAM